MVVGRIMQSSVYTTRPARPLLKSSIVEMVVVFLCLFTMMCLGGCLSSLKTDVPGPERIRLAVLAAVKASADATSFEDIAKRAVENAEGCKNAADSQLALARAGGDSNHVETAAAAVKRAAREAMDAREMARVVAVNAAGATNDLAAIKQMVDQAASYNPAQTEKLAGRVQRLSDDCLDHAALAKRVSDALKQQWLLLVPVLDSAPARTNGDTISTSDSAAGDNRRQ